jgi:hypothetical protein
MKIKTLSLIMACTLMSNVYSAEPAKLSAAEQQATKAEIDSLVQRIQELSKKLGPGNSVVIDMQRVQRDGPPSPDLQGRHKVIIDRFAPGMEASMDGMRQKPGIGIVMAPNVAANGVLIGAVTPDGPAAKAGLRSGDVLLGVDGKNIGSSGREGIDKARELLSKLKVGQNVQLTYARAGKTSKADVKADTIGRVMMMGDRMNALAPMLDLMSERFSMPGPNNNSEQLEIMQFSDCEKSGKKNCAPPGLFEALRWQGLNLASLDTQLGRYFGTDKGVLVISPGPGIKNLQSGDVIQRAGTTSTLSPRDVMRVLREKKPGEKISLTVLRERKAVNLEILAPAVKTMMFLSPPPPPPAPPAPPAAPAAPAAPAPPRTPGMAAPPAPPRAPGMALPPAPPAPPIGMQFDDDHQEHIVWMSKNDDANDDSGEELEIEISK